MKWIGIVLMSCAVAMLSSSCGSGKEAATEVTESNIDSLLTAHPDSVPLLVKRGEMYFKRYEYDLALKDAAKAFRLAPLNLDAKLLYAEVINSRSMRTPEEVGTAQRLYQQVIKKQPKNTRALVGLASTYSYQADFEKSFKYINQALRIDVHDRNAYVLKGSNYMQLGNKEKAISSYETAVQQDPNFFEAYFFLAKIYESEGNKICIDYYQNAHELRPKSLEITYSLGYARQLFEEYEGAKEIYREMAKDTLDFYANRGYFHQGFIKQFIENDLDSAVFFYRAALREEPRHVESWHNLGICYDKMGDKTQALQSFGKALKYDPQFELSRQYADSIRFK